MVLFFFFTASVAPMIVASDGYTQGLPRTGFSVSGYGATAAPVTKYYEGDVGTYADIVLEETESYPALHGLISAVIGNASKAVIRTDQGAGATSVDWYAGEGFGLTARYVDTSAGLELLGFEVAVPDDVLSELGIDEDSLAQNLRDMVLNRVNSLPQWVSVENVSFPGVSDTGEIYLTVNGMRLAMIDEVSGSIQTNLGLLYMIADTRQGVGVVFYDRTKLVSHALTSDQPRIISPSISVEEAKALAWDSLRGVIGGEPDTVTIDDALALLMPNGTIVPTYVVRAVKEGGNFSAAEYTVIVNMANGEIIKKVSNMEALGPQESVTTINLDRDAATTPEKETEQTANDSQTNKPQEGSVYIASAVAAFAIAGIVAATFLRSRASKSPRT